MTRTSEKKLRLLPKKPKRIVLLSKLKKIGSQKLKKKSASLVTNRKPKSVLDWLKNNANFRKSKLRRRLLQTRKLDKKLNRMPK